MSTSFQRRPKAGSQNIPGTKFSSTTSSLIVSSGIPALDAIIDGGLPLGSLCVIEEDKHGSYSKILMKCFLAEGVVHKNHILAASCDENTTDIIKSLPSLVRDTDSSKTRTENVKDELKIAWRYENLSVSGDVTKQQNHFDLSKPIAFESLLHDNVTLWDGLSVQTAIANGSLRNTRCRDLLTKVYEELEQRKLLTDNETSPNLMRISIFSLGSPLWDFAEDLKDLTATLVILKSLLRAANAVGLVTIPAVVSVMYLTYFSKEKVRKVSWYVQHFESVNICNRSFLKNKRVRYRGLIESRKTAGTSVWISRLLCEPWKLNCTLRTKREGHQKDRLPERRSIAGNRTVTCGLGSTSCGWGTLSIFPVMKSFLLIC
nr:EOG090X0ALT [Eulimnadia texana]